MTDKKKQEKVSSCENRSISRRGFLGASAAIAGSLPIVAGPFTSSTFAAGGKIEHYVPVEKKLSTDWLWSLTARGVPTVYSGEGINVLGMPTGGIGAGQLYVTGDGTLACWHLYNRRNPYRNAGYEAKLQGMNLEHGFAVSVKTSDGRQVVKRLNRTDFPKVGFIGQYPISKIQYPDSSLPIDIEMECYSPFIPLNAKDSALPATLMEITITNTSEQPVQAAVAGWIQSLEGVLSSESGVEGQRRQQINSELGMTRIDYKSLVPKGGPKPEVSPPEVFADFEKGNYGGWRANGKAFGDEPASGKIGGQQAVKGFKGKGLVNTYKGGDASKGRLVSPEFTISRPYINFLVGGGANTKTTFIRLLVGGKEVARTAGREEETLRWSYWQVKKHIGKSARIEIVDDATGNWGHLNIDHVEFADEHRKAAGNFERQTDFGSASFAILEKADIKTADAGSNVDPRTIFSGEMGSKESSTYSLEEIKCGALGRSVSLKAGESKKLSFVLTWYFPRRLWDYPDYGDVGNYYSNLFEDAAAVALYVHRNYKRLSGDTHLYHETFYNDSTLPHWLLERIGHTPSILASGTVHWRKNGRFWGWEGVGCCAGTCTHVWNYEHALARLFPELERSMREMQDFGVGFSGNGLISFRGDSYSEPTYAADGQAGTVLKAYREHQMTPDNTFLERNWPKIKKTLNYCILRDRNKDGIITDTQHNTYDINFHGPNPMIGSLYLAALRSGEEMAGIMGDDKFAKRCRDLFKLGSKWTVNNLFDGEYFTQFETKDTKDKEWQYIEGCLSDQLFGQGWAHQLGMGYIYPKDKVDKALQSIFKYNWTPDVDAHNKANKPRRWFARSGDAGLFICTWPKSARPGYRKEVVYRNEVWTGIEYQAAGNMIYDGLLSEGLTIIKGIQDRHSGIKHNPFNEVECGDHYARAMAAWGCLLAVCGMSYDGPKATMTFAPKMTQKDFKAFFTGAEGWGTLAQKEEMGKRTSCIEIAHGSLPLKQLTLDGKGIDASGKILVVRNGKRTSAKVEIEDGMLVVDLRKVVIQAGQTLEVIAPLA
jgi:uncharacterized protein (DUF608 family)